jgi:predicted Zn-dependent peptidase
VIGRRLVLALGLACAIAQTACDATTARGPETPHGSTIGPDGRAVSAESGPAAPAPATPAAPRVPTASRRQLPSGATIVIVEDRDAPRVAIRMAIGAGTASDTERAGASIVAAHAMAMSIEDAAAALGAHVGVVVTADAAIFSIDVAPDAAREAIELCATLAKAGSPTAAQVARATRRAALEAKRLAAEGDDHAAAYVIVRDVYDLPTARHPYGTTSATAAEIAEVTAADVRSITKARYVAAGSTLVVVGDVGASDAVTVAEGALSSTSPKPLPRLDRTEPFARDHDRVTLVDRPGAAGGHVMVGLAAPTTDDATTLAAIELAVEVLAARLGGEAAARLYTFEDGPSIARVDLRAGPHRAAGEVQRVHDEIDRIAREAPTSEELSAAKRRVLGRAARALATPDGVADALAEQGARAGLLERRLAALSAATPEVVSIAAQPLSKAKAHVVVSADAKTSAQELTSIAEVKVIDPLADYARLRSVQAPR